MHRTIINFFIWCLTQFTNSIRKTKLASLQMQSRISTRYTLTWHSRWRTCSSKNTKKRRRTRVNMKETMTWSWRISIRLSGRLASTARARRCSSWPPIAGCSRVNATVLITTIFSKLENSFMRNPRKRQSSFRCRTCAFVQGYLLTWYCKLSSLFRM